MRTREASLANTKGRSRGRVHHGPEQFLEGNDLAWVEFFGHTWLYSIESYCLMDCLHRCFVVRFTHLIRDVFSVDDTVIAIDHKDGPLEQPPLL